MMYALFTFQEKLSWLKKILAGFLMIAINLTLGGVGAALISTEVAYAASLYGIAGESSLSGTILSLSGTSFAAPETGADSTQHMAVDWDADQNASTIVWEVAPAGGMVFSPTFSGGGFTATWNASHDYLSAGTHTVRVMVYHGNTSGHDGSASLDTLVFVVVIPPASAPVLGTIGNQIATELVAMSLTATATDTDGNPLTFSITGAPSGSSFNTATGVFDWTPSEEQGPGVYPVTISVSDGTLTDSETFNITVNEANVAPVLTAIGNQAVDEASLLQFTISATDADLPANTLTYSATNLPTDATFNPATRVFSWTPTYNDAGTYSSVHFEVSDGTLIDSEDIMITVNNTNRLPVLDTIGNKTPNENESVEFTVTGSDPDGDTLDFSATSLPTGATFLSNVFSWIPDFSQAGNYIINFLLSDGNGGTDSEEVHIDVGNVNRTPNLDPIADRIETEMVALDLTGTASDPDGDALTYSLSGEPDGMTIDSSTGVFTWTPTEDQGSTSYAFEVKVTDNGTPELTDTETVRITVEEANIVPVAEDNTSEEDGGVSTLEDTSITLTLGATDSDFPSQTLTFSTTSNPTHGALGTISGNQVTYTPEANYNGSDSFTFKANDGTADSNEATVEIDVTPVNDAPEIELVGLNLVSVMVGDTYVEQGVTTSDVDEDELTQTTTGTVDTNTVGEYVLTYEVSDGEFSASTTRTVNVTAVPPADVCPNIEGTQETVPSGKQLTDGQCIDIPGAVLPPSPSNPPGAVGLGFLGGNANPGVPGLVLGASTSTEELPASCGAPYLTDYLRMGKKNNPEQVVLLQTFLNANLGLNLPVTGYFGSMTHNAVKQFQTENADQVLDPWVPFGLAKKTPTGYVYKTTKRWINLLECKSLDIPMPQLP